MSSKKPKATRRRMISCFAQIVQEHLPGWKIEELAAGEKIKAPDFNHRSPFTSVYRNHKSRLTFVIAK